MKILIIHKYLYPKGGDSVVALSTGELFQRKGHEVIYWGMNSLCNTTTPAYSEFLVDEIDLEKTRGIKKSFRVACNILYSFIARKRLEKFINQIGKPDIVHLHNFAHHISPSILHVLKRLNIPCVMTMHEYKLVCASYLMLSHNKICEKCSGGRFINCFREGCVKDSKLKSLLNTMEMYLHHKLLHIYNIVHIFMSPSVFLKDKIKAMGFKNEIEVLPNFIDSNMVTPHYSTTEQSICYVGRLSKEKGIITLIKAVKSFSNVILKIIGEGPIKDELHAYCIKEKIRNVNFIGYRSGYDLKSEICKSICVVVPSEWYEVFGMVIAEAFALGKPVIGARIGGIPELVKEGKTGLLFTPGNVDELRACIEKILNHPEIASAMGRNGRNFVEAELNTEKYYQALLAIYQKARDKHNA